MDLHRHTDLTLRVLRRIGSPAGFRSDLEQLDAATLGAEETWAWENRISLLYLLSIPDSLLPEALLHKKKQLIEREAATRDVMTRVCRVLDSGSFEYVIFKTVRPYPFTPNDVDILFLGRKKRHQEAVVYLRSKGYKILGVAPLQTLAYDPAGEGKVTIKKDGGVYYLDLYQQAGSDYFVYLDNKYAATQVQHITVDGVTVPVLKPELELAVFSYHNVFPENTFHLEHLYVFLYYLYGEDAVDLAEYVRQVRRNHYTAAVRANLTLTAGLHAAAFGFVPDRVLDLQKELGVDTKTDKRLQESEYTTPYYFRPGIFIGTPIAKLVEFSSLKSMFVQFFHMLRPSFMVEAFQSLFRRIGGRGVYELK